MPVARNEALLREVLNLPLEERADVAAELLASLESVPTAEAEEIEREWAAEVKRRARRVMAGVPWEEVKLNVRSRLR